MAPIRVCVLSGGVSAEHDVSLASGKLALENLDTSTYDGLAVTIARDGSWHGLGESPLSAADAIAALRKRVDCVFIALHGPFGEDGRIQGAFDTAGIPYTGSGCAASALAMDKVRAKAVARQARIPVAEDVIVYRSDQAEDILARVEAEINYPVVAKCATQGSSLGLFMADDAAQLEAALPELFALDDAVVIEKRLSGAEVTCGVLDITGAKGPQALPLTEIAPKSSAFFDYTAKYTPGATEEITPARVSNEITAEVQRLSLIAHRAMGCSGMSRSDYIVVDSEPIWLEVNTIPGLTETSLLPQGAAAAGIPYPELISLLIEDALKRR